MDDNEFKQKLSKIAKWYIPIVRDGTTVGIYRKPMPSSQPNTTIGPVIEELLPCLNPCEWCGKIIDRRTILHKKICKEGAHKKEWQHNCQTCRKQLNPKTGKVNEPQPSKYRKKLEEAKAKLESEKKKHWWNDPVNYTGLDNDKLG